MALIPKLSEIKEQIASWSPVARLVFFIILIPFIWYLLLPFLKAVIWDGGLNLEYYL
jgi:hypothetical protein